MSSNLSNINLSIIGKPNSGKSTLFNSLVKSNISPVGNKYGLTKTIITDKFSYRNYNFTIIDTPGLRRKSKVSAFNEMERNKEVIKLISNVNIIILLIDSLENITKQDFRLADLSINRHKIIFFLFNKIDLIEDKKKFKLQINKFLKNNYNKSKMINIMFISAKKNIGILNVLNEIIEKNKKVSTKIPKKSLNKFINSLNKKRNFPKIKDIEVKPKYIVQLDNSIPKFKVFINSTKKAPILFQKYFDNIFREYFKLQGIPIIYYFESSKNPFSI